MKRIIFLALTIGFVGCAEAQPEHEPGAAATSGDTTLEEAVSATAQEAVGSKPEHGRATGTGDAEEEQRRVVYVDVRTPEEWAAGRVEGAIHIPHTELAQRLDELEEYRDADIVLYCRTGRRSGIAQDIMAQAGFERLRNGGGLSDLAREGVPIER